MPQSEDTTRPNGEGALARVLGISALVLAAAHIVLNRLAWSEAALQVDAGMWAYAGQRILDGALPYADVWDQKPPGIYYAFAAVLALFDGRGETALLWFDAILTAGVLALTYRLARRFGRASIARVIMLPAALVLCHRILSDWGLNTEKFVALFEAAAMLLLLRLPDSSKRWTWLAAGMLCGAAFTFKQTGILMLLAATLCAPVLAPAERANRRAWIAPILQLWLGFAVLWLPVMLLLAAGGILDDFVRQVLLYDLGRVGARGGEGARIFSADHWHGLWDQARLAGVLLVPGIVACFLWVFRHQSGDAGTGNSQDRRLLLPILHFVFVCFAFCVLPRGYGHYLLQAVPSAAVLCVWALETAIQRRRYVPTAAVIIAALVGALSLGDHIRFTLDRDYEYRRVYRELRRRTLAIAEVARENSQPGDTVLIWPPDRAASFYAGRRSPLEGTNLIIVLRGKIEQLVPPMRDLLKTLEADPPPLIVDASGWHVFREPDGSPSLAIEPGISLLEPPDASSARPDARVLSPFKEWIRANYGAQHVEQSIIVLHRGEPWRRWEDFLPGAAQ